jgi:hypothetical protein
MADADAIALGLLCFAATAICGFFGAVAFATTTAPPRPHLQSGATR